MPEQDPLTGRFVLGNRGGPGNPRASDVLPIKAALEVAFTPEDVVAVMMRLKDLALEGSVDAARLWLDRRCGKVKEEVGVSIESSEEQRHRIMDSLKALVHAN